LQESYENLINMKHPLNKLREYKTIAEMLNFKVVQLQLSSKISPTSHFEKHIKTYCSYTGDPRRVFEHFSWLTRQYSIMAELLEGAPGLAIASGADKDGGFYYDEAITAAMERRNWAEKLCRTPAAEARIAAQNQGRGEEECQYEAPRFLGQEPIALNMASPLETTTVTTEADGETEALEAMMKEKRLDHNALVRGLLDKALDFARRKGARRMQEQLNFRMGHELWSARMYSKAKHVLDAVAVSYRKEKWWPLLTPVVNTSSLCAWHMGQVEDYIKDTFELISTRMRDTEAQKLKMQEVVTDLIAHPAKFASVFKSIDSAFPITYDVHKVDPSKPSRLPLLSIKVQWIGGSIPMHERGGFRVAVTSHAVAPLAFASMEVSFGIPSLDTVWREEGGGSGTFTLKPETERRFEFDIEMGACEVPPEVSCKEVLLHLGGIRDRVRFRWSYEGPDPKQEEEQEFEKRVKLWEESTLLWGLEQHGVTKDSHKEALMEVPLSEVLIERPTVYIRRPDPLLVLEIIQEAPALVHESYPIKFKLSSNLDSVKSGYIELREERAIQGERPSFMTPQGEALPERLPIPQMAPNEERIIEICTCCETAMTRGFVVSIHYETTAGHSLSLEVPLSLTYQEAVSVAVRYMSSTSSRMIPPVKHPSHGDRLLAPLLFGP